MTLTFVVGLFLTLSALNWGNVIFHYHCSKLPNRQLLTLATFHMNVQLLLAWVFIIIFAFVYNT